MPTPSPDYRHASAEHVLSDWWTQWVVNRHSATGVVGVDGASVAVALSGGPDSVALAASLAPLARAAGIPLQLWHVHHGLSSDADRWQHTCRCLAEALALPLRVRRVVLPEARKQALGVEAAAREARYEAFRQLAREHAVGHLVLAHHADDQAETVLIRLLRGAGPSGLAAMQSRSVRGGLVLWRPWLSVPREAVRHLARRVAERHDLVLADDPSNHDVKYARGQLREVVMPAIADHWPGYRSTLLRHARQAAEIDAVLNEVAEADLDRLRSSADESLDLTAWLALSPGRATLVLRAWFGVLGAPPAGAERQAEFERQLREARVDRQLIWRHGGWEFTRHRQRILARTLTFAHGTNTPYRRVWRGEALWSLPGGLGHLHFDDAPNGWDPGWLRGRALVVGLALTGGRLRLRPDGPSRSLKRCFQEAGVPAWERAQCLRVHADDRLVFVHRLGQTCDVPFSSPGVRLRWRAPD